MNNLFSAANKLKSYTINIGGTILNKEAIISSEVAYTNNSPKVICSLVIKDLHDLNLIHDWKTINVIITYVDIFDEDVEETFIIKDISEEQNDRYEKFLYLELQDIFSYKLENSFLSKSFKTNAIDALKKYITHLGIDSYKEVEFSNSSKVLNFTVPENINNLEWFMLELNKYGFKFYQTKDKICVKSYEDLIPSNLSENNPGKLYLDETSNQLYMNKIYDSKMDHLKRECKPDITRYLAFDINTKTIKYDESNNIDELLLNDDDYNILDSSGKKDYYLTHLDFNQSKSMMKDNLLTTNEILIVVNGYKKNDLNQIYELKLRGNKSNTESQNKGNMILSGKWISQRVTDKIIGDSMVQKIILNRADMVKKS